MSGINWRIAWGFVPISKAEENLLKDLQDNGLNYESFMSHRLSSYNWDWLFTPAGKQIKLYKKED